MVLGLIQPRTTFLQQIFGNDPSPSWSEIYNYEPSYIIFKAMLIEMGYTGHSNVGSVQSLVSPESEQWFPALIEFLENSTGIKTMHAKNVLPVNLRQR